MGKTSRYHIQTWKAGILPHVSGYKTYEVICYARQRERGSIWQLNEESSPQAFNVAVAVEFGGPVWFAKRLGPRVHDEHHMMALLALHSPIRTADRLNEIPYIYAWSPDFFETGPRLPVDVLPLLDPLNQAARTTLRLIPATSGDRSTRTKCSSVLLLHR